MSFLTFHTQSAIINSGTWISMKILNKINKTFSSIVFAEMHCIHLLWLLPCLWCLMKIKSVYKLFNRFSRVSFHYSLHHQRHSSLHYRRFFSASTFLLLTWLLGSLPEHCLNGSQRYRCGKIKFSVKWDWDEIEKNTWLLFFPFIVFLGIFSIKADLTRRQSERWITFFL